VIKEPIGGAHRNQQETFESVKQEILKHLKTLNKMKPQERVNQRIEKFSSMGVVHELDA
jgi:acetyl-CoA carboxylase carboxyl transferase subunit alpha